MRLLVLALMGLRERVCRVRGERAPRGRRNCGIVMRAIVAGFWLVGGPSEVAVIDAAEFDIT